MTSERELHGLWLSHKDRMRYLQFLELAYVDGLVSDESFANKENLVGIVRRYELRGYCAEAKKR